jgi:hypothetical protein
MMTDGPTGLRPRPVRIDEIRSAGGGEEVMHLDRDNRIRVPRREPSRADGTTDRGDGRSGSRSRTVAEGTIADEHEATRADAQP